MAMPQTSETLELIFTDLRHTTVAFSDTELVFEISSENAVTAAPVWVETETLTFYFFTRNAATSEQAGSPRITAAHPQVLAEIETYAARSEP